eukprot:sb/3468206/
METRLNDAEHKLAVQSTRSAEIRSASDLENADARHKSVKQKLQREVEMLENSLETAHATIKTLQSQLPGGADADAIVKQVQENQEKLKKMQDEYRRQVEDLEVALSTQTATLTRRENELKMLREQVSQLEGRLERAATTKEQDLSHLRADKTRFMEANQKLEQQNLELVTLCERVKGDYERQSATLTATEAQFSTSRHELGIREEEVRRLEDKVRTLEERVTTLRNEKSASNAAAATTPDSLLASKEAQIGDLEEKLNEQSEKYQVLN